MPSTPSSLSGKGGRVPQTDPDTLGAMDESPSLAGAPHLAGVADSLERGDAAMGEPDDDDETVRSPLPALRTAAASTLLS